VLLFAYIWSGSLRWPSSIFDLVAHALVAFLLLIGVTLGVAHFHPNQVVADQATRILAIRLDFANDLVALIVRRPNRRPWVCAPAHAPMLVPGAGCTP
jgi:hypothetical protein